MSKRDNVPIKVLIIDSMNFKDKCQRNGSFKYL